MPPAELRAAHVPAVVAGDNCRDPVYASGEPTFWLVGGNPPSSCVWIITLRMHTALPGQFRRGSWTSRPRPLEPDGGEPEAVQCYAHRLAPSNRMLLWAGLWFLPHLSASAPT